MSKTIRRVAGWTAVLLALALVAPSLASAQYREFSGRIDKIGKKKMIVDNRMGDKVSFVRTKETEVSGEGKSTWRELRQKDWVVVSWKFTDKPRIAYKIVVVPPKEEAGEDE